MRIILNGRHLFVDCPGGLYPEKEGHISYDDVVEWAGRNPAAVWTVAYSMPAGSERRDGSLIRGQDVAIEDGMIFTVADTSSA